MTKIPHTLEKTTLFSTFPGMKSRYSVYSGLFSKQLLEGFVVLVVQFKEGSLENHHLESIHSLHTA